MGVIGYFGIIIFGILAFMGSSTEAQLQMGFYAKSCPKAEKIVHDFVNKHIHNAPSLAASFIRMNFHDCFVRGCDASVLLNSSSSSGEKPEKEAAPNLTIRGFDFIDRVKSLLEAECPGVVSCADILALVSRDSIVATGGPFWKVPTGRRDGVTSRLSDAMANIPPFFANFTTLQTQFANQGLDLKDLVLLSGAHTIGIAHCSSFSDRLYNFSGTGLPDPSLDSEYVANLRENKCKSPDDNTTKVEMDPGSRNTFDLSYYSLLVKRRGLFESDAALITDSVSLSLINQLLSGSVEDFFAEFANSMEKMIKINVKTGTVGEIRKHCAIVNS
ncbi:hypothetical protein P3X46_012190 [Hevea brasiliensis]|uniref:Peroxidase n=1 Tax=Hevea brasiliensis TaxID=3981 RepID=A0ABQ9M9G4_HEVBR|nr:peroxidase 39 [Hevea brasiliensis]KAJ9176929.1 hypothetical protein P3X46_012190 [Hevea brasiliensis]